MIIGDNDQILFESTIKSEILHNHYFNIYSSLDNIDEKKKSTDRFFLKQIDDESNKSFQIYAYMTSEKTKFVYLFEGKDEKKEDQIKQMFAELHNLFAGIVMNPLYRLNSLIKNQKFEENVTALLKQLN